MTPIAVTIAGSDSSGGAGIQADLKTFSALGVYGASVITALTAQNTEGVFGVEDVPPRFVQQQMRLVLSDIGADCLKTGMLHSAEVIQAVSEVIRHEARGVPLVVDPVMVAKGGAPLLAPDALGALKSLLLPLASVVTPNQPEAELLVGFPILSLEDQKRAGAALIAMGAGAALMEHLVVDKRNGFFVNHDLAGYEVPVHADIPHQDVIFLDETDPISSPMKAKGVGELGICGVGAAIANAIYNATGVRVRDYPITLDKLIEKMPLSA